MTKNSTASAAVMMSIVGWLMVVPAAVVTAGAATVGFFVAVAVAYIGAAAVRNCVRPVSKLLPVEPPAVVAGVEFTESEASVGLPTEPVPVEPSAL
jgi:hypothetical protein